MESLAPSREPRRKRKFAAWTASLAKPPRIILSFRSFKATSLYPGIMSAAGAGSCRFRAKAKLSFHVVSCTKTRPTLRPGEAGRCSARDPLTASGV